MFAFRNFRTVLSVSVLATLLTLVLTATTPAQATPPKTTQKQLATLAGTTWTGTTTFLAGSRKGQSQPITLTFQRNGGLLVQTDGSTGYGYWFNTPSGQIIYTFREMHPTLGGDVQVVHLISFVENNHFISNGEGYLYQDNQPSETIHNITETQASFEY